jgi:hypothetical protein
MHRVARRFAILVAAALVPVTSSAQWGGGSIQLRRYFPSMAVLLTDHGVAGVGAGVEFPGIGGFSHLDVDLLGRGLDIAHVDATPRMFAPAIFNGYRFTDVGGTIPPFLAVTVHPSTSFGGFDLSRVTVTADDIWVNLEAMSLGLGDVIALNVITAAPEPVTAVMVAAGLAALGALVRRRGAAGQR